jgi:hypothetical protein
MVSKRQKFGILVVLIIIIAPAITWLAVANGIFTPKVEETPSTADIIILKPGDLGTDWQGGALSVETIASGDISQSHWVFGRESNQTPLQLDVFIHVFNSTTLCRSGFLNISTPYLANSTNLSLGDEGISYYWSSAHGSFPCLIFTEKNVLCWMETISSLYPQTWWQGALFYIASYQLQKIDHYLAG